MIMAERSGLSTRRPSLSTAMLCIMITGHFWLAIPHSRPEGEHCAMQKSRANQAALRGYEEGLKKRMLGSMGPPPGTSPESTEPTPTLSISGIGPYPSLVGRGGKETISGHLACSRVQLALNSGGYQLGATPGGTEGSENPQMGLNFGECACFGPEVTPMSQTLKRPQP